MNIIEAGGGRCICELRVDEEHQNRAGTLHGGMTATLVDIVSTAALMSNDNTGPGVSVDMTVSLVLSFYKLYTAIVCLILLTCKTDISVQPHTDICQQCR